MIIGRGGTQIEKIKAEIQDIVGDQDKVVLDIKEIKNTSMDAVLVAKNVAFQLEKRMPFRRAMKKTIQLVRDAGAQGIKIKCAGRLGGAEIARSEDYKWGKIPLQTMRADIDYGFTEAKTTYGLIGIKVWIYKGEKLTRDFGPTEIKKTRRENTK
jgi:small subunit ribosomal protein S3